MMNIRLHANADKRQPKLVREINMSIGGSDCRSKWADPSGKSGGDDV